MTLTDFKAALTRTRLSLDGRATHGALLVLVDGASSPDAALQAECSHQAIAKAVKVIRRAAERCAYCGAKVKRGA